MAGVAALPANALPGAPTLLPASLGHAVRGSAPPVVPGHAIEAFAARVAAAHAASLRSGREQGFLAYVPHEARLPFQPEEESIGTANDIRWHWREREAAVAFSFHTHPGADSLCIPSGTDALGALVRGDHVIYMMTMDGRLSGWRFRRPYDHVHAVESAVRALDAARELRAPFVDFLYDAFEALRPLVLEPVYAARLRTDGKLARATPGRGFFLPEERRRSGIP